MTIKPSPCSSHFLFSLGLPFYFSVVCDCPNGYMRHDETCYKLFASTRATWAEAFVSIIQYQN
jgi:hypothetical protein